MIYWGHVKSDPDKNPVYVPVPEWSLEKFLERFKKTGIRPDTGADPDTSTGK